MKTLRKAAVTRKTKETEIFVEINLDGTGKSSVDTGIPFLNHMLDLFSKHGSFDLKIVARGDLDVDFHHTIEDLGIVLGEAINKAVGEKRGIARYGWCILPMDEALAMVSLDLSGRSCFKYDVKTLVDQVGGIDAQLFHEFFYAVSVKGGMTLHIKLMSGDEIHHIFEAVFKAFSKSLALAVKIDGKRKEIPSTKGSL